VPAAARVRDEPSQSNPTPSRLDSLPLVSRVTGMLRGLRFNVASQKLEEVPGDVTETGNDVNDNEKPYDDLPLPAEAGYDIPSTAAEGKSAKKKHGSRKTKKSLGRKEKDSGEKHHKMEENSTDSDEDLTGKTARKLTTEMGEKGENVHHL